MGRFQRLPQTDTKTPEYRGHPTRSYLTNAELEFGGIRELHAAGDFAMQEGGVGAQCLEHDLLALGVKAA